MRKERVGMRTIQEMRPILDRYAKKVKELYGAELHKVVLYGSYARGDYTDDSDVDIMVLLNVPHGRERAQVGSLIDMTCDFNDEYDLDIQPIAKSLPLFQKWQHVLPFYRNVHKEGVTLYENNGS